MNKEDKSVVFWLLSGCLLIFIMVIVGGITRLTHSGLSMVEWRLFMGSIPPMNDVAWKELFDKYQQFPEFQQLNYEFTLQDFKSIFFWEYFHRMIGRLLGIVFIVPFIYFVVRKRLSKPILWRSLVLFAMGGFQGFLGWWMVKSGLLDQPHVSHIRLAIHLVFAFLTFGFTFWVALELIYKKEKRPNFPQLRKLSWVFFPLVIFQIVYGAFVAGLKAGLFYNTFPKMGKNWIPDEIIALQPIYYNFINGIAGVQFVHRYTAYVVAIMAIYIWWIGVKKQVEASQLMAIRHVLYAVVLQFTLGVFTLLNGAPVSLGVAHQLGAFFLLASAIYFIHRFSED